MKEDFKKVLNSLIQEVEVKLKEIRGHRLGLSFLENLEIEVYSQDLPLKSLGFISQLDFLTFRFEPYDETILSEIESALLKKNLGLNLSRDKKSLIIKFPPLTEETKKNILKTLNELKEDYRVRSRRIRDDFLKKLRSQREEGQISEDYFYKTKEDLDKQIEEFNKKLEALFQAKEKEILG